MQTTVKDFFNWFGIKDHSKLNACFTHPTMEGEENYQRLELLGDRILNAVVMDLLFKKYPLETEGELSLRLQYLTSGKVCAQVAKKLRMDLYIRAKDESLRTNDNVLADVCEAFIGALYVSAGFQSAYAFVEVMWDKLYRMPVHKNPKVTLQEWAAKKNYQPPLYKLMSKNGPEHRPTFMIKVECGNYFTFGAGSSRKEAEMAAAEEYISYFKIT